MMDIVATLNEFVPLVVAIAMVYIAYKLMWWGRLRIRVERVNHALDLKQDNSGRWVMNHSAFPAPLRVQPGDTVTWTLSGSNDARLAFPSIVFKEIDSYTDHKDVSRGDSLTLTVSQEALPGSYPYSVEILDSNGEGLDSFVIGGSHTRLHIDPW